MLNKVGRFLVRWNEGVLAVVMITLHPVMSYLLYWYDRSAMLDFGAWVQAIYYTFMTVALIRLFIHIGFKLGHPWLYNFFESYIYKTFTQIKNDQKIWIAAVFFLSYFLFCSLILAAIVNLMN